MKRSGIVLKCILAALPLAALIAFTLLCPMYYMDREYPAWRFSKNVCAGSEYDGADFDTVILGDSGAMGSIMPEMFEGSCVNLAVGGATSIEMYYFLEEYLKHHSAPKTAVIMFAPFHYWHIDNYETRTVYFRAIPASKLPELYKNAKSCGAGSVAESGFITDELGARCALPNKYLPAINAARFTGRYNENTRIYSDLISSFGYGQFGDLPECHDRSYETSYEDMVIDGDGKLITLYMQRLLKLCEQYGIHVRLIQPAVNTETFEGMNRHYIASYRNYIKQLSQIIPDIEYETELRVWDGKYFADASHLNAEGARRFSEEITE